jgi:thiamine biosynthesis lipoprotein ApbE
MKDKPRSSRWLTGAAAGLTTFAIGTDMLHAATPARLNDSARRQLSLGEFSFAHEGVLGTSLDLIVHAANREIAHECERQVLSEIERLRQILSTRDSASVISRFLMGSPVMAPELQQLLNAYQFWNQHTRGAIDVNMAGVIRLWEQAQVAQRLPDAAALARAFRAPLAFNVDALGKGFIVDRAVEVARRFAFSGLLNIGGDLRSWGSYPWPVGIADPRNPAENAPVHGRLVLRDAAVATSGGYARHYTIAGKTYSHVIDPRTLQPVDCRIGATVVAADCLTANALATAACVLGKVEGENLLRGSEATGYLLTDATEGAVRGGLLASVAGATETPDPQPMAQPGDWPQDFQVSVNLQIKAQTQGRSKRPYVAVWVQDANEKYICTVAVWGTKDKYIAELSHWWNAAGGDQIYNRYKAISRATRAPGKYTLVWDGRDDFGKTLPQRDYTICVELNRENGHHAMESVALTCRAESKSADLAATAESDASTVEYGPKPK